MSEPASAGHVGAHLLAVEPAADTAAVEALRRAADGALLEGAPASAVVFLRRALAEPPGPDQRFDVLFELGRAACWAPEEADNVGTLREAHRAARSPAERARVALELQGVLRTPDELKESDDLLDRAAAELADTAERELLLAVEASERRTRGAVSEAARLERYAALPGSTIGERMVLARLAENRARLASRGAEETAALAVRAFAGWRWRAESSIGEIAAMTAATIAAGLCDRGDAVSPQPWFDASDHLGREPGWGHGTWLAGWALTCGRLREAQRHLDAARAVAERLDLLEEIGPTLPEHLAISALVAVARNDTARALAELQAAPEHAAQHPTVLASLGVAQVASGEAGPGVELLVAAGERYEREGLLNPGALPWWRAHAVPALMALDRAGEAARVAREGVRRAERFGAPGAWGMMLRARAATEPRARSIVTLQEAVRLLERSPRRLELGWALHDLGGALRRDNQKAAAREPLRRALELAIDAGGGRVEAKVRAELRAADARPRRDALRGRDALTASERRVAEMAVRGLPNRAIATELVVSLRTVELHLTSAYRKLDIAGRPQLAAALAEHPD
jgi:DNA-binding CsgD family transcriptional regulator